MHTIHPMAEKPRKSLKSLMGIVVLRFDGKVVTLKNIND
jgi:hypothetical protein